jgi:hypothetical protein
MVVKFTKIEWGEVLQDIEVQQRSHLRRAVSSLVRVGKLFCPESAQEQEYAATARSYRINERSFYDRDCSFRGHNLGRHKAST